MTGDEDSTMDVVQLWLAWKHANEHLRASIIRDVNAASDVGEPERTVLIHLHAAGGTLRQNALAAATGWDRGRLSHLLTRMEDQRLVARTRLKNGVEISISSAGERAWADAEASLRDALGRHVLHVLDPEQVEGLRDILRRLTGPRPSDGHRR
ncbi:MarR family winged helix-turn-helix transcriptional regulator [Homoserinibacter sp. YIM 151385]|uniref:MarR family winged helix-turn-helix transcriptional regulator n=1 Tax=Homoserinibacter sp. YIM 151385 TaxID=2985506 RepID=UPI0022F073C5|nr:MarR family winged helix-turn-helix transcriptional regulator [Homoserinibacter sp. YIM 151385]WBU37757.1 MarR family winged helix-turn-helix transcriptional regulator [Homoserinibacter sp. YIM 151385]